jgi:hypothetical protein
MYAYTYKLVICVSNKRLYNPFRHFHMEVVYDCVCVCVCVCVCTICTCCVPLRDIYIYYHLSYCCQLSDIYN